MIGRRNDFGPVESGNGHIYFVAAGSVMKVKAVPQFGQNERTRPAHSISRGSPLVNRKLFRRNEAQVTKGAPALLRQSSQWQCVIL
jgi:hypothetical protein